MINKAFRLLRCSINSSLVKEEYLLSSISASCMSVDPRERTEACVVKLLVDRKCNSLLVGACISLVGSGCISLVDDRSASLKDDRYVWLVDGRCI